jgi:hypothetical protein
MLRDYDVGPAVVLVWLVLIIAAGTIQTPHVAAAAAAEILDLLAFLGYYSP